MKSVLMVVQITRDEAQARAIERALQDEGLVVKLRPIYRNLPDAANSYEIQVLKSEASEAHRIIVERGLQ